MKKNDKVKIKKGHGTYNKVKAKVLRIDTIDNKKVVLLQGDGLSGAIDLLTKKPIPNARYAYEEDLEEEVQ